MKFIHCSDFHLDTAFSGLGDGKSAAIRQQELRQSFLSVIELAKEADGLLIAGDLFDNDSVEAETIHTLRQGFASLGDIPVLIVAGNHDPLTAHSYYRLATFSPNVHIFGTELSKVAVGDCDVYGISFADSNQPEPLLTEFCHDSDRPSILLIHGDLSGGAYNPINRELLAASGLSYVALGHVHGYESVMLGRTLCVYPGCPEGRGFDELGEKGVVSVEVTEYGAMATFVPICKRQYRELSVDITDLLTHDAVIQKIREQLLMAEDLYKVILTGETEFVPDGRVLESALSECFFIKIVDVTKRPLPIETLMQENGVRGMFTQKLHDGLSGDDAGIYRRALEIGLSALSGEKVKGL